MCWRSRLTRCPGHAWRSLRPLSPSGPTETGQTLQTPLADGALGSRWSGHSWRSRRSRQTGRSGRAGARPVPRRRDGGRLHPSGRGGSRRRYVTGGSRITARPRRCNTDTQTDSQSTSWSVGQSIKQRNTLFVSHCLVHTVLHNV